jgi:CRP-like cAMP-binding protein
LFIAEGRVRVYSDGIRGEAEVGAGDALGTLSVVDGGPRMANAETLSRTRLCRLRSDAFRNLMASEPTVACRLLEGMVRESARALREEVQRGARAVDPTHDSH